jgi:hypothetical protein
MPSTIISTRDGWVEDPNRLLDAAQDAFVETIGTPKAARHVRLQLFPDTFFSNDAHEGPHYTLIEVTLFSGRSVEIKQNLFAALKRNFSKLGVPEADVKVILYDVPRENWI